ncbi:hypothetical protein HYH38_16460 [Clostridium botulinum]|uniref:Uncharacterized protein n=1 Tax=Clostridium botulinum TaxID=1491 RepID=A0A126JIC4_CLOBO|nr:hypothetical protein [Clostridium botulinum]ALT05491.1 hypothetical protein [Clostridium botulinum]ALT05589.1 hypothetical protein [Clostridium botulinum]MBY6811056.1 hypothetical protein [Clostridium botulinum]MBY6818533.1 hypothetical protein [Clostridium botulinum]MBY6824524.1 hypothetical protein [Clostridium botulinum]
MCEIFNNKVLGTCQHLNTVSRNQIINRIRAFPNEVNQNKGNLYRLSKYLDLKCHWLYRFPYKQELNNSWEDDNTFEGISFSVDPDFVEIPHRDIVQTEIGGNTYNIPFCPASKKAAELGVRKINHWGVTISIFGERYTEDNPDGYTLFECKTCEEIFSLDRKEALYIKERLNSMGYSYEADCIKYRNSEELISKAREICEYANSIDNEGLTYSFQDALTYIKEQEDDENRDIPLEELKDTLFEINHYSL